MQKQKRMEVVRNMLVLAALVGLVLLSWLLGHTLRYSFPGLWHPPIQDKDPQIKVGMEPEPEGIRRQVAFSGMVQTNNSQVQVFLPDLQTKPSDECQGFTYFTSLPAKCLTADGRFVQVGEVGPRMIFIPPKK